MKVNDMN